MEGRLQGREEGRLQGREEGRLNIARRFIKVAMEMGTGTDGQTVADFLEIPLSEVTQIMEAFRLEQA